jgi:hypothetical protein
MERRPDGFNEMVRHRRRAEMIRRNGISAIAIATALLVTPMLTVPAAACMLPPPDDASAYNDLLAPAVPISGSPERDGVATGEKYVILAPSQPGRPPQVVRWNGLDVAPAPHVYVVDGKAVARDDISELVAGIGIDPRAIQQSQVSDEPGPDRHGTVFIAE